MLGPEAAYIENKRHVREVEVALFFVVFLQLCGVVVLALLCYMRAHVRLLFSLQLHP